MKTRPVLVVAGATGAYLAGDAETFMDIVVRSRWASPSVNVTTQDGEPGFILMKEANPEDRERSLGTYTSSLDVEIAYLHEMGHIAELKNLFRRSRTLKQAAKKVGSPQQEWKSEVSAWRYAKRCIQPEFWFLMERAAVIGLVSHSTKYGRILSREEIVKLLKLEERE